MKNWSKRILQLVFIVAIGAYVGVLMFAPVPSWKLSPQGYAYAQTQPTTIGSSSVTNFGYGVRNGCSGTIHLSAGLGNSDQTLTGANVNCLAQYKYVQCYPVYPAATATPAGNMPLCFVGATATQFATQSAPTATASAVFAVMPTTGGGPTPTIVWQGIN